ncbi:MAG: FAD-dependent monooxygenase [Xanthomonadales bacterium]|nr:FAD-dependent monooxygenase [Xanthomonadales bacterium]
MTPPRILVAGAGPAGQAMALAIAANGLPCTLLDPAPAAPEPAGEPDLRVFALTPASLDLLVRVLAWPPPQAPRIQVFRRMQVWERDPADGFELDAAAGGASALGAIVEHSVLQHALAGRLAVQTRVERLQGAQVLRWQERASGIEVELADGRRREGAALVAADGAGSPLRRQAGIDVDLHDYRQRGLVANVVAAIGHGAVARQRFLPGGPLALLPLPGDRVSIVWTLPTAEADRLAGLPDSEFDQALTEASGGILGRLALAGPRAGFPLRRQLARRYREGRMVLLADAAHAVHPLAGQGLNLGLADVAVLAPLLAAAVRRGLDPGSAAVLARYERARQGANALAAHGFGAILGLYACNLPGAAGLRAFGHGLLRRLPALRRAVVGVASG